MVRDSTEGTWSPYYEKVSPAIKLFSIGNYAIMRCCSSGLVFLDNALSDIELEQFYSLPYFEGDQERKGYTSYKNDEPVIRSNCRHLANMLGSDMWGTYSDPSKLALLDYGCAYGYFLDEASVLFGEVRGIEINDEVARVGRERFGLTIDSGPESIAKIASSSMDVVTMWDVIEHLRMPRSTLMHCARVLKTDGRIYLSTGDIDSLLARLSGKYWRLLNPPQHICYFSASTITSLLDECGFEVTEIRYIGKRVSLEFILFIVRYLIGARSFKCPFRMDWLMRRCATINLFDVMYITAHKR